MDLVFLSFFKNKNIALNFSNKYVLDFKVAGKLLYKLPELVAEL